MVGIAIAIGWALMTGEDPPRVAESGSRPRLDRWRIRPRWLVGAYPIHSGQRDARPDGRYAKAGEDGTLRLHSQSDDAGRVVHISWDWGLDGFRNSDRVDVGGVQPAVGLYLRSRNP